MVNGKRKLRRGAPKRIAEHADFEFKISVRQVWRICRQMMEARENSGHYSISNRKKGNSGRPRIYIPEEIKAAITEIPRHKRRSIRAVAAALGIPKSTINVLMVRDNYIRPHTNTVSSTAAI